MGKPKGRNFRRRLAKAEAEVTRRGQEIHKLNRAIRDIRVKLAKICENSTLIPATVKESVLFGRPERRRVPQPMSLALERVIYEPIEIELDQIYSILMEVQKKELYSTVHWICRGEGEDYRVEYKISSKALHRMELDDLEFQMMVGALAKELLHAIGRTSCSRT